MRTELFKVAAICAALALSAGFLAAESGVRYEVTITNLTHDQILSPPVVVVHDDAFRLFQSGQSASAELAGLAEDAVSDPLLALIGASDGVTDYTIGDGVVPPGATATLMLRGSGAHDRLSLAGMLVSTNDAFVGVAGVPLAPGRSNSVRLDVPAYDAGSEANTEACTDIPGPPCGNPGVRVTEGAEGFVHIHRGVQGVGDLAGSKDWRNPSARVTVRRIGP